MRKNLFFLFLMSFLALFLYNCSKTEDDALPSNEIIKKASARTDVFALTTDEVRIEDGVLIFATQEVFDAVVGSLTSLSEDEQFEAEFINSKGAEATDFESPNFVKNAAFQAFEERFEGYVSLRKAFQNEEFNGAENELRQDIQSPVLQTLMNAEKEVKIGDFIYKDIDAFHTFIVLDGNLRTLDELNTPNPLTATLPKNVVLLDNRIEEDRATARGLTGSHCYTLISYNSEGNDKFGLYAHPVKDGKYVTTPNMFTFIWKIYDKNGVEIFGDATLAYEIHPTLPANTEYPITVKIHTIGGECPDQFNQKVIATGKPNCDFDINFNESSTTPGSFSFFASPVIGSTVVGGTFTWTFNQGGSITTLVGQNVTFDATANFTVSVTQNTTSDCDVTRTLNMADVCGSHQDDRFQRTSFLNNTRRAECVLWIDNKVFYNGFGAKQNFQRRKNNGNFTSEKADALSLVFNPNDRFIKDCNTFQDLIDTPYNATNSDNVRCNFQYNATTGKPFVTARTGEVTCTFSAKENGVDFPNHTVLSF